MDNHRTDNIISSEVPVMLKDVKKYQWFTLKPLLYPRDTQVFVKGDYDRCSKKYCCFRFSDINDDRLIKGTTLVYVDFIF